AKQHLNAAIREHPDDSEMTKLLEQTDLVLASDPLERHLPREQRVQRTLTAFNQAGVRLDQCGEPVSLSPSLTAKKISNSADSNSVTANTNRAAQDLAPLATEWNNLRPSMNARSLSLNSDLLENAVDLVS